MRILTPFADKAYREWYEAPKQKLARGLASFLGVSASFSLMNNNAELGLNLGLKHGFPNCQLAISRTPPGAVPFIFFGLGLGCVGADLYVMGKRFSTDFNCSSCVADRQRSKDAILAVEKEALRGLGIQVDDEPLQGAAVSNEPKPKGDGGGSLLDWPN